MAYMALSSTNVIMQLLPETKPLNNTILASTNAMPPWLRQSGCTDCLRTVTRGLGSSMSVLCQFRRSSTAQLAFHCEDGYPSNYYHQLRIALGLSKDGFWLMSTWPRKFCVCVCDHNHTINEEPEPTLIVYPQQACNL